VYQRSARRTILSTYPASPEWGCQDDEYSCPLLIALHGNEQQA
jgi:hypothetical protein